MSSCEWIIDERVCHLTVCVENLKSVCDTLYPSSLSAGTRIRPSCIPQDKSAAC